MSEAMDAQVGAPLATYYPEIFLCQSIKDAKAVIVPPGSTLSPQEWWDRETAWIMEHISLPDGLVLDYGCGIGRLARRAERPVIGVDVSHTMRAMADGTAARHDFGAVPPMAFRAMARHGLRCFGAIAAWTLHHCLEPEWDIANIAAALLDKAVLWVIGGPERAVPGMLDGKFLWCSDDRNIGDLLARWFVPRQIVPLPTELASKGAALTAWQRDEMLGFPAFLSERVA